MQTNSNTILATTTLPYVTVHLVGEPTAETTKVIADLPDHRLSYFNKATGEDIFFFIKAVNKQPLENAGPENIITALGAAVHQMVLNYAKEHLNLDVERVTMGRTGRMLYVGERGPSDEEIQRDRNEAIDAWNGELFSSLYGTNRCSYEPMTLGGCQKNRNLRMSLGKNIMFYANTKPRTTDDMHYRSPFSWGITGKLYLFNQEASFVVCYDQYNFGIRRHVPMDLAKMLSREVVKAEIIQRVKMFFPFLDTTTQAQVISDIVFDEEFKRPENENVYS